MANDRCFIKCLGCGAEFPLFTYNPTYGARLSVPERLEEFLDLHLTECREPPYTATLEGDPGFTLVTETRKKE